MGDYLRGAGTESAIPRLGIAVPQPVIVGVDIADGSGAPLFRANVQVLGDRIARVGDFLPDAGEQVMDAKGLVLAPGFIDTHNHSDDKLESDRLAETQISQGLTTVLLGQDGRSPWPIGQWLDKFRNDPPALNCLMLVGRATLRRKVMGGDFKRPARPEEIAQMSQLVEQACATARWGYRADSSTRSAVQYNRGSRGHSARGGTLRRILHISHTRRGGPQFGGHARTARDRPAGRLAGAEHAHQAGIRRRVESRRGGGHHV
jgi:N-acyl-D-aspartate/D-glutamate deacylase